MAALRRGEREFVCLSKVENMDVVADAGPVRRIIIVAVEHQFFAFSARGLEDQRDQVGFGPVVFAEIRGCSRGIEVAQRRVVHAVDFPVPLENFLEAEFGFSIGIDRNLPVIFPDRNRFRLPEGGRGARKNEHFDTAFDSSVGEVDAVGDVVPEVLRRILHRFADQREGGEVHDCVEFPFAADALDLLAVGEVAEDEFRARIDRLAVAGKQAVEDGDVITVVEQVFRTGAADVAGSSGDQNFFHFQDSCGMGDWKFSSYIKNTLNRCFFQRSEANLRQISGNVVFLGCFT